MQAMRYLFSPNGRLRPQPFAVGTAGVYVAGLASQLLTTPEVIARFGLGAFTAVQAVLIWAWFSLHAKRLHDAGRDIGIALAATLVYCLAIVLLLTVAFAFFSPTAVAHTDVNATSALGLILLVAVVGVLLGAQHFDLVWMLAAVLTVFAFVPVAVMLAVTLWAATRPSVLEKL